MSAPAWADSEPAPRPTTVNVTGYAQVDWTVHDQSSSDEINESTGAPLNQDRFLLRRGHLRVDADRGLFFGVLELDLNTVHGAQARPVDAEIAVRIPAKSEAAGRAGAEASDMFVSAAMGLMKIPFGFEVSESDARRPFLERSTSARALFPGQYDLGARLQGGYRVFEGSVAVMNGSPLGDKTFPALAPTHGKEVVGRLGVHLDWGDDLKLEAGVSFDTGTGLHEGTPTTKDELVWRDDNGDGLVQATEVQVLPGASSTSSQTFHRSAIGADARLFVRLGSLCALTLRTEIVRAHNLDRGIEPADPVGGGYDLRELGYYVGVVAEISPWIVTGARYDRYSPDQDASARRAERLVPADRTYSTWAFLLGARYGEGRLSLEYDRNGNALGRDASGAPTTLAADTLTLRAQVQF